MAGHFEEKGALAHVLEKRVEGTISVSEAHGAEMPGHLSASSSAAQETAIVMLLIWLCLAFLQIPFAAAFISFAAFGTGWFVWKSGRSGWLGWSRLERLHRLIEQERYEIEYHRPQEREELVALYGAKGFEGQLLEDVVDTLMADQDRLLKVMLEEEMGLTLEAYEHPLQQCLGAAVGSFVALVVSGFSLFFFSTYGMVAATALLLTGGSVFSALFERNRMIPAIIWNLSIGTLAVGVSYFLLSMFL